MSRAILEAIERTISAFDAGEEDLPGLQLRLGADGGALDNTYAAITRELRAVDADLEKIRFTVSAGEQQRAVIDRLSEVRRLVREELED